MSSEGYGVSHGAEHCKKVKVKVKVKVKYGIMNCTVYTTSQTSWRTSKLED
jgi:hypothetical protein